MTQSFVQDRPLSKSNAGLRNLPLWLLIPCLALVDQFSKWWVMEVYYKPRVFEAQGATIPFVEWLTTFGQAQFPPTSIEILPFFNLVMVWNKGVSFGMFASAAAYMPYILGGMALVVSVILSVWLSRAVALTTRIPLAMVIAGALANVWDRARFGAVADFLDFHVGGWHYPAFNVADCCVVVGVIALAFDGLILEKYRLKKEQHHE